MLNIAIIGAGRIGAVHAATVASHPRARLVLVADPFGTNAADVAAKFGARSTTDVADVFAASDVDAVIIGSPTATHVDHIIAAVRAGKAVLCEKPVDLSLERVDACLAAIAGHEDSVMIGFNRRFDPSFAEVHARVLAGEIGALEQLTIISRDPAAPPASYIAGSGGIFRDMTIHDFDTARYFLGDIVSVSAVGQHLDAAIEAAGDFDAAVVTLTAASGAVATIINSRHCASGYDQRLEAFGPRGALEAINHLATSVRYSGAAQTSADGPYLDFFLQRYADAYRLELSEFIDCVTAGAAPSPSILDGRAALILADAATLSARTGETVAVAAAPEPVVSAR
ncbi:inositol 2-dehydrogenase [Pengzhenrongella sicca]|uniref:Inositol 2-dehydrogenase n=1 Tax=Pengzhenrongella sicca TaxID=2819238 RepID=A0A8A4ZDV2_9MICO|nr:inositol 2-dehydrogenase [Pengzhenrongella sicca]QTE30084.1 inositol 2-dehydrogenase [Pengzhenrongella sicca]